MMEYPKTLFHVFLILFLMEKVLCLKCYESNMNAPCTHRKDKAKLFKCYQNLPTTIKEDKNENKICLTLSYFFDKGSVVLVFLSNNVIDYDRMMSHYREIIESATGSKITPESNTDDSTQGIAICNTDKCNVPINANNDSEDGEGEEEEKENNKNGKSSDQSEEENKKEKNKSGKSSARSWSSCVYNHYLLFSFVFWCIFL